MSRGSNGSSVAAVETTPGEWLLVRRSDAGSDEYAYYRAYGPDTTPLGELIRAVDTLWVAQEGIDQARVPKFPKKRSAAAPRPQINPSAGSNSPYLHE